LLKATGRESHESISAKEENMFSRYEIKQLAIGSISRRVWIACPLSRAFAISVIMLLVLVGAKQIARGAAGDPDQTFGTGGHVFTDFSGNSDYGFAIAIQPDGRLIVAGQSGVYPVFHAALARYNTNGQLDPTFGSGGKVITPLDTGGDGLSAIALQPGR
jgi:hypothetical protein